MDRNRREHKPWQHFLTDVLPWISLVIGALGIIAPFIIQQLDNPETSLGVTLLTNSSLVQIDESVLDDISVTYRDQPLGNLSLIKVRIENDGRAPIDAVGFSSPLILEFPSQAEVIQARVSRTSPPSIPITCRIGGNTVVMSKALLNAGDQVILEMLVIDLPVEYQQPMTVNVRIKGLSGPIQVKVATSLADRKLTIWETIRDIYCLLLTALLIVYAIERLIVLRKKRLTVLRSSSSDLEAT